MGGKTEKIQIGELKFSVDELTVKKKVLEGNRFYFRGHYQRAIESYDQAAEIDGYYADAWYNMGKCYEKLKRYEDAIGSYEKVIEIDPKNASALYSKGTILSNEISKQKYQISIVFSIVFLILITVFFDIGLKEATDSASRYLEIALLIPLIQNAGTILILIAAVIFFFYFWYKEGRMYYGGISPGRKKFIVICGLYGITFVWVFSLLFLYETLSMASEVRTFRAEGYGEPEEFSRISDNNQTLISQATRLLDELKNKTFGLFGSELVIITSSMITVSFILFLYNAQNAGNPYLDKARELGKSL